MPAWALALLIKVVLPLLLSELVKAGVLTQLEAGGIKTLEDFKVFIANLKAEQSYPGDPKPITTIRNFNLPGGQ